MTDEEKKELERLVSNRKLVTYRVLDWCKVMTKGDVCEILKISRPTLDRRLSKNDWKLKEIKLVMKNMLF